MRSQSLTRPLRSGHGKGGRAAGAADAQANVDRDFVWRVLDAVVARARRGGLNAEVERCFEHGLAADDALASSPERSSASRSRNRLPQASVDAATRMPRIFSGCRKL